MITEDYIWSIVLSSNISSKMTENDSAPSSKRALQFTMQFYSHLYLFLPLLSF